MRREYSNFAAHPVRDLFFPHAIGRVEYLGRVAAMLVVMVIVVLVFRSVPYVRREREAIVSNRHMLSELRVEISRKHIAAARDSTGGEESVGIDTERELRDRARELGIETSHSAAVNVAAYALSIIIVAIMVFFATIPRARDLGMPAVSVLISFVPVIGQVYSLLLFVMPRGWYERDRR